MQANILSLHTLLTPNIFSLKVVMLHIKLKVIMQTNILTLHMSLTSSWVKRSNIEMVHLSIFFY